MNSHIECLIHLLHEAPHACLATHSLEVSGYPFLSILPFVPDQHHCPLFLISRLAEHSKNLAADRRASALMAEAGCSDVQAGARVTLIGEIETVSPSAEIADRYVRYQPSARRCLNLADFFFVRLRPRRLRFIEGFGRMGWTDGQMLADLPALALADEVVLTKAHRRSLPADSEFLGIDRFGIDVRTAEARRRIRFGHGPVSDLELNEAVSSALRQWSEGGARPFDRTGGIPASGE